MDVGISIGHMPGKIESPLEERFAVLLDTSRAANLRSECQVEVPTRYGRFRLDVLLTSAWGRKVGVELDGRAYHDGLYDTFRDAAILGTGPVARIIRIRGKDLHRHPQQVMYLLSQMEPWCVSDRGRQVLGSQMRAVNAQGDWANEYGTGVLFGAAEEPDAEDGLESLAEPSWPEVTMLADHTLEHPNVIAVLKMMGKLPRLSLRELVELGIPQ